LFLSDYHSGLVHCFENSIFLLDILWLVDDDEAVENIRGRLPSDTYTMCGEGYSKLPNRYAFQMGIFYCLPWLIV
jgi:hypothetical protein